MARLATTGFEFNDLAGASATHPDSAASGGGALPPTISSANPRTGTFHGRCAYLGGTTSFFNLPVTAVTTVTYSVRTYFYLSVLPAAGGSIQLIGTDLAQTNAKLFLAEDGTITRGAAPTGGAFKVTANSYFELEFAIMVDTANAANDTIAWRLNDTLASSATVNVGAVLPTQFRNGVPGSFGGSPGAITVDVDDIALNDSTGGNQTSWPGAGAVVLLKPISDNAKGAGWTNDAAGASNFFDAVDNLPPVGIADTTASTGLHQIRNATANANSNYDANLTTYTNAGVGASDTINVLVPAVATAAPVTTSSKQGTFGVSSNPVITNVALSATGTAGAFWSGVAAGTYASGWKWSFGTTTYAPPVTLGNSPVARITQVTSSTRIAMVCAMGMYVDYTPAAVAAATFTPVLTTAPYIPGARASQ